VYLYRQENTHFHGSFYHNCTLFSPSVTITKIIVAVHCYEPTPSHYFLRCIGKMGFQMRKKTLQHLQHSASDPCTSSKIFSTITNVWAAKFIQNETVPFKMHRLFFQHTTPSDHHYLPLLPMLTLRLRVGTCNSSRYWPSQRASVDKIAQHPTRIENYGITPFQFVIIVAKFTMHSLRYYQFFSDNSTKTGYVNVKTTGFLLLRLGVTNDVRHQEGEWRTSGGLY
jgi:hypothetical protein